MLFIKMSNPLAAAAGGYVLLATEQGTEPNDWHRWIENLCNWFEWLPDGAILHASLKLRHQYSDGDLDEARRMLIEAYRRGLPFYSVDSVAARRSHRVRRRRLRGRRHGRNVQRVDVALQHAGAVHDPAPSAVTDEFRIEMLPAREGDCLVLVYGQRERPRRVLIDGGRKATYRTVKARFAGLPEDHERLSC